ncbi:MAG: hypothetical protein AB8C13_07605 [Phycisphaerales bacterium]
MNFQTILNFITNPIGIVILFGLFSTVGRLLNNAKEQRAKKQQLTQVRNAQRDSLRTGSQQGSAGPKATPSVQQTTQAAGGQSAGQDDSTVQWDKSQDLRRQRIQELRAKRDAQMKKIQQRSANQQPVSSQAGSSQSGSSQAGSSQGGSQTAGQPPQPPQARQQQRPTLKSRIQAGQQSASRSASRSTPQISSQPAVQAPMQQESLQKQLELAEARDQSRRVSSATDDSVAAQGIAAGQITVGSADLATGSSSRQTTRKMLRGNIKQAIIAKEVLGTPLGLRTQESGTMPGL